MQMITSRQNRLLKFLLPRKEYVTLLKIAEYLASKKGQKQEACDVVEELALADTEVDEEITEEELTEEV